MAGIWQNSHTKKRPDAIILSIKFALILNEKLDRWIIFGSGLMVSLKELSLIGGTPTHPNLP